MHDRISTRGRRLCVAAVAALAGVGLAPAIAAAAAVDTTPSCYAGGTLAKGRGNSSGPISLFSNPLNFHGESVKQVWVNNPGNVTFNGPMDNSRLRLDSTTRQIIAPFLADVDTRAVGTVTYGTTTAGTNDVFCANWINVGYYDQHGPPQVNSFQLKLINRPDVKVGDFDIELNYDRIRWESGDDASNGAAGGFGGLSAVAGYSNGASRSFELPGSGVNGAWPDSNTATGLIHNKLNSSVNGRYVLEVRSGVPANGHKLSGFVINDTTGSKLPGTVVSACDASKTCVQTTSGSSGDYTLSGLASGTYDVYANPQFGVYGTVPVAKKVTIAASMTEDLHVHDYSGFGGFTGAGAFTGRGGLDPTIPQLLSTDTCPNATGVYVITFGNSTTEVSGALVETPAGSGHYEATVPPLHPNTGYGHVHLRVYCPGGPATVVDGDFYIDPSGVVQDTTGASLDGANVTLLTATDPALPFVAVANGSDVMSPKNRKNPDVTSDGGKFGWDVMPDWYKVRAEAPGCHAPGDPATSFVETNALQIPPAVTNLVLTLECSGRITGEVPGMLALSLGRPATFGRFTPGVTKDYTATMGANVVSTAADALLTVADAAPTATGSLVNGRFSLPAVLRAKASSRAGLGGAFANVGGSAAPTPLLTYSGPASNDNVALSFLQRIGADDALRRGTYGKSYTFTLSTTEP